MRRTDRPINAWLLTWEGTRGPATKPEQKVIAILSGRKSSGHVSDMLRVVYSRCVDTAYDMRMNANKPLNQAHFRYGSRMFLGYDPFAIARLVESLRVVPNPDVGIETLEWTEPAVWGNAESGAGLRMLEPAERKSLTRPMVPLSSEYLDIWQTRG